MKQGEIRIEVISNCCFRTVVFERTPLLTAIAKCYRAGGFHSPAISTQWRQFEMPVKLAILLIRYIAQLKQD